MSIFDWLDLDKTLIESLLKCPWEIKTNDEVGLSDLVLREKSPSMEDETVEEDDNSGVSK
jgi:hypothetical protein